MFHFYQKSAFNAMCNYFWKRRIVFLSLTVYFMDTATDLVVVVTWYDLMMDETSGEMNYESIDMRSFFWPMLAFFFLYQILLMLTNCDSKNKIDVLLSIVQLYPFRALWVSLEDSNRKGIDRREERRQSQLPKTVDGNVGDNASPRSKLAVGDNSAPIVVAVSDDNASPRSKL